MKYKIAIVEDVKQSRELVKDYIKRFALEHNREFEMIEFEDGEDIIADYGCNYDIIFLDIEMKRSNGMEIAEKIRKIDKNVIIIFKTNMAQYAIRGYSVDALSFLLKPVPYFAFSQELKKSIDKLDAREDSFILISAEFGMRKLMTKDILYIESMKHTLIIRLSTSEVTMRGVMKDMEDKLEKYHFHRCNNCYLVNLSKVKGIQGEFVIIGNDELKMSRGRKKSFMEALTSYVGEVS